MINSKSDEDPDKEFPRNSKARFTLCLVEESELLWMDSKLIKKNVRKMLVVW